jgi:hypothetical protein
MHSQLFWRTFFPSILRAVVEMLCWVDDDGVGKQCCPEEVVQASLGILEQRFLAFPEKKNNKKKKLKKQEKQEKIEGSERG